MLNIAICDDDKNTIQQVLALLNEVKTKHYIDFKIDANTDGEFSVDKNAIYDIAILDIEMQGINGLEVAENLKRNNPDVIVIILTSYSDYLDSAMKISVFRYLSKPIDSTKLEQLIIDYLPESLVHITIPTPQSRILPKPTAQSLQPTSLTLDRVAGMIACNHSIELYEELLDVFCNESLNYLEQCSTYLATDDWDNLLIVIQTLQNNAHNIGALHVMEQAEQLQLAVRNRDKSYIFSHYHMFRESIKAVITQIESEQ